MPPKTNIVVTNQRRFLIIIFRFLLFLIHQSKPAATPKLMSSHPVFFFMKPFLLDFWLHYKKYSRRSPSFELTDSLQFRHPCKKHDFLKPHFSKSSLSGLPQFENRSFLIKKNRNSLTGRLSISIPTGMIFLLPGSLA